MISPFKAVLKAGVAIRKPFSAAWDLYVQGGEYFEQKQRLKDHQNNIQQALLHELAKKRIEQRVADMPYCPDGNVIKIKPPARLGGGGQCPRCNEIVDNLALHVARECKADFSGHIEDCFLKPDESGIQHLEPVDTCRTIRG